MVDMDDFDDDHDEMGIVVECDEQVDDILDEVVVLHVNNQYVDDEVHIIVELIKQILNELILDMVL